MQCKTTVYFYLEALWYYNNNNNFIQITMKTTLTAIMLMLICSSLVSQNFTFTDLVKKYQRECDAIVTDTISQQGTVNFTHVPVKDTKGKIMHYVINATDTIWSKPKCPTYKYTANYYNGTVLQLSTDYDISYANTTVLSNDNYAIINTAKERKNTIYVTRDYVCECKLREVQPFSEHFWKWLLKQD